MKKIFMAIALIGLFCVMGRSLLTLGYGHDPTILPSVQISAYITMIVAGFQILAVIFACYNLKRCAVVFQGISVVGSFVSIIIIENVFLGYFLKSIEFLFVALLFVFYYMYSTIKSYNMAKTMKTLSLIYGIGLSSFVIFNFGRNVYLYLTMFADKLYFKSLIMNSALSLAVDLVGTIGVFLVMFVIAKEELRKYNY